MKKDDKVRCKNTYANLEKGKIYKISEVNYRLIKINGLTHWYSVDSFELVKEEKGMKKDDLESGMVVENRQGNKYLVEEWYYALRNLNENLQDKDNYTEFDILATRRSQRNDR